MGHTNSECRPANSWHCACCPVRYNTDEPFIERLLDMLKITVLGYPSVALNDVPVTDFISQKALVLLCYLALERRQHSREALAGLLWAEMPQERALSNLRQALHNLQKLAPGYVLVTRQTVQFDAALPFVVDAQRLEDDNLEPAHDPYHDMFMAGVFVAEAEELESWILRRREHYAARYAALLDGWLQAAVRSGDWLAAEHCARRSLLQDPYRESAYQALWRALVRRGDVNSALASYQSLAERLNRELGVEPTPETQRMAAQLAAAQGVERHNLPMTASPFVGREQEIAQLHQWLADPACRLVTIVGVGGCGKSRLAQAAGMALAPAFVNGVRYIALGQVTEPIYLVSTLAQAVGLPLHGLPDPAHALERFLAEREMLLILDQVEHLPEIGAWVSRLVQAAPSVKCLLTSRQRLGLREEWVLPLTGFAPDAQDGVQLLSAIARQNGATLVADDERAADLVRILDGLPLGIELAGAMLAETPLERLLGEMRGGLDVLQSQWQNAEPRHRSLRAIFMASWQSLPQNERCALADLACFPGGFSAAAAAQVAQAAPTMLEKLAQKSLLSKHDEQYRLHAVIRHYAGEQQRSPQALEQRFTAYCQAALAEAEQLFASRAVPQALRRMQADMDNLRLLWQQAVQGRRLALLQGMAHTMHRYYEGAGLFAEGLDFFRMSLDTLELNADRQDEALLEGRLLAHRAGLLLRLGHVADALAAAEQSVALISRDEQAEALLAFALNTQGIALLYTGDVPRAAAALEQCAALYRQMGMVELVKPLVNLGSLYTRTGDIQAAKRTLEEAHRLAASFGDRIAAYHIANGLGTACVLLGEYDDGQAYLEEALLLAEETGFAQGRAMTLNNLGDVWYLRGQPLRAQAYAEEAAAAARQLNDVRGMCYSLTTLALSQMSASSAEPAQTLLETLEMALASQAEPMLLMTLYAFAVWLRSQGRQAEALPLLALVAQHPAAEYDFRQRARRLLGGEHPPGAAQSLAELAQQALAHLRTHATLNTGAGSR